jgi:quercetin dioxygenase-like cupin family protein
MKSSFQQFGDLLIHLYDFEIAGEGLPDHNHDHSTAHVTFVRMGCVEIKVHGEEPKILAAGGIIDLPYGKNHSITALVDGTKIANVRKFIPQAS